MRPYDALVIGGGPAGATAAVLLAQAGWSVILVERKDFPRRKVCGEFLSATNWPLLGMLGITEQFAERAGPPIRKAAIFTQKKQILAELPPSNEGPWRWGRALGREHLDSLLIQQAARCGVDVRQPARCIAMSRAEHGFTCRVISGPARCTTEEALRARVVVAAHGSWEVGPLATQRQTAASGATDWVAFKAHFTDTGLAPGVMPLLAFPGGYGGMVHTDGGRTTLSCCVRRGRLAGLERTAGSSMGEAVGAFILDSCPATRRILAGATRDGPWLAAGPIQPGIRPRYRDGVFVIGNAAGEAHPVVAEGISMAMQSAWLLVQQLAPLRPALDRPDVIEQAGRRYAQAWHRSFAPRIRAAAAVAHWASRPAVTAATLPLVRACPRLLTLGARLSGKARPVVAH